MLSPVDALLPHMPALTPAFEPRFDGGLPPEQESSGAAIVLWKVPEVAEPIDASPCIRISTLKKGVFLRS